MWFSESPDEVLGTLELTRNAHLWVARWPPEEELLVGVSLSGSSDSDALSGGDGLLSQVALETPGLLSVALPGCSPDLPGAWQVLVPASQESLS